MLAVNIHYIGKAMGDVKSNADRGAVDHIKRIKNIGYLKRHCQGLFMRGWGRTLSFPNKMGHKMTADA
jgi:hypothetical protein